MKVADYTTIYKRLKKIKLELPSHAGNDVIIALDSTCFENNGERTRDGKMMKALINKAKKNVNGRIKAAYGDEGYNSKDNCNFLDNE